jgi:integrase
VEVTGNNQLWLRAILALGYTYGFRRGELVTMRCKQVDLLSTPQTITLYSGETKNAEGRRVVLTAECLQLVTELRKGKEPDDLLITRGKYPVKDFRRCWELLTQAAGVPGLLLHDLRRSAVRNMVRRGVSQKTARTISGHKTDSVFSRYNIVSDADIAEAARLIEAGAKTAIHGSIQSSFRVEAEAPAETVKQNVRKPV